MTHQLVFNFSPFTHFSSNMFESFFQLPLQILFTNIDHHQHMINIPLIVTFLLIRSLLSLKYLTTQVMALSANIFDILLFEKYSQILYLMQSYIQL